MCGWSNKQFFYPVSGWPKLRSQRKGVNSLNSLINRIIYPLSVFRVLAKRRRARAFEGYKDKYEDNPRDLWNARTYIDALLDLRNLYKSVNDNVRYKATDLKFKESLSLFSRETGIQKSQLRVERYREYLSFVKKMKQGL